MRRFVLIFLLLSSFVLQAEERGVFRFWWNMGNVRDGYVNGVAEYRPDRDGATTTVGLNVVDTKGASIEGAKVLFRVFTTFDHCNKIIRDTDAKGYCEVSAKTRGEITVVVDKDGYYTSYGTLKYRNLSWEDSVIEHKWTRGVVLNQIVMKPVVKPQKHLTGGMTLRPPPVLNKLVPFDAFMFDWCSPYGKGVTSDFFIGCYDVTNATQKRVRGVRIIADRCVDGFLAAKPDKWSKFKYALMADIGADYKREVRYGSVLNDEGVLEEGPSLCNGEYLIFRTRSETNEVGRVVSSNYGLIGESLDFQTGLTLSVQVNPKRNDTSLEHDWAYRLMKKGR